MSAAQIASEHTIKSESELRSLFGTTHELAILKCLNTLDKHSREFIARAPFLCIGTQNRDGKADVSPRGDPPGFVKILDDRTIAIPDRPGNNRLDTLSNIVANPNVGLLFIVPGFDDTLRISGQAKLVTDPELLKQMAVQNKTPNLAIVVTVDEVFLHCAKAFRRSNLWNPEHRQDRTEMPSLVKIILDQTTGAPEDKDAQKKLDDGLEESYQRTMY